MFIDEEEEMLLCGLSEAAEEDGDVSTFVSFLTVPLPGIVVRVLAPLLVLLMLPIVPPLSLKFKLVARF